MQVTLNGQPYEVDESTSAERLLEKLELSGQRLAFLLDDEVVRRADFPETQLSEGCRVEIVQMVGGG